MTAELKITLMDHNLFLFEFPSRQEATRIMAGDWFGSGRHLSLDWWSLSSTGKAAISKNIWVKVFGVPLHAWSLETFKLIGDKCGGFIGMDEDTENRSHFFWSRIYVKNTG